MKTIGVVRMTALWIGLTLRCGADGPVTAEIALAHRRSEPPKVALKDMTGRVTELREYRGKVVLLDFWATWCGGCKEELPWFAEFESKFRRSGFAVVAVSMDEDGWRVVDPYVASHRLPFKVLLDDGQSAKKFGIENMPVAVLIDRKGRVAAKYSGLVDRVNIEANIQALLRERR